MTATWQERFFPESRFGGFTDIDGTIAFYTRVHELLPPRGTALDIGCGRGAQAADPVRIRRELRTLGRSAGRVIGIDVDPAAAANPLLNEFRLIETPVWPIESATIDVAVADWVVEHVSDPGVFFAETFRVLRPGGCLCLRTANARSLVGLAARLIPNRLHARVLQVAQHGRKAQDVFPTVYRCNTRKLLHAALQRAGFQAVTYGYEGEPQYHNFSGLAYAFGVAYQRWAPKAVRSALFGFALRPNPD
jgi:SAM-dependent methyltransferase